MDSPEWNGMEVVNPGHVISNLVVQKIHDASDYEPTQLHIQPLLCLAFSSILLLSLIPILQNVQSSHPSRTAAHLANKPSSRPKSVQQKIPRHSCADAEVPELEEQRSQMGA